MTSYTNIDLRYQIACMLRGKDGYPPFGRPFILRKVRRTTNGEPQKCVCYNEVSGDAGVSTCTYCKGLGYLFDDVLFIGLMVEGTYGAVQKELESFAPGKLEEDKVHMIAEFYQSFTSDDQILEPKIPETGSIIPVKIYRTWNIKAATPVYGVRGRVEYWWITLKSGSHNGEVF